MDLNKKLDELLNRIKFAGKLTLDQIEKRMGYAKGRLSQVKSKGQVTDRLLKNIENEFRDELGKLPSVVAEQDVAYTKKETSKVVDGLSLVVHNSVLIKSMLRVLLRSQAELLAAQQNRPVKVVLAELTKAVRAETSNDFSEL